MIKDECEGSLRKGMFFRSLCFSDALNNEVNVGI